MSDAEREITRYLFAELAEAEAEAISRRCFEDEDFYDSVRTVEDELVDSFVRGELPAEEAKRVDLFLRDTYQEDQLRIAQSFAHPGGSKLLSRWASWRMLAIAACVFLLLGSGIWLWSRKPMANAPQRAATSRTFEKPPVTFSFWIAPGVVRGERETKSLSIPPGTQTVAIEFELAAGTPRSAYSVDLQTTSGRPLWKQDGVTPEKSLIVKIPADVLRSGNYEATLRSGGSVVDYYYFHIN